MRSKYVHSITAVLTVVLMGAPRAQADDAHVEKAKIIIDASSELRLQPDQASIFFTVRTQGKTVLEATKANASRSKAIKEEIEGAGIEEDSCLTRDFHAGPHWQYEKYTRKREQAGFEVRNTLEVQVKTLGQLGSIVDAGLEAGADEAGPIIFSSSKWMASRQNALRMAVEQAKNDAEIAALAAGGTLGTLIEIVYGNDRPDPGARTALVVEQQRNSGSDTNISAGELLVQVHIQTTWEFKP